MIYTWCNITMTIWYNTQYELLMLDLSISLSDILPLVSAIENVGLIGFRNNTVLQKGGRVVWVCVRVCFVLSFFFFWGEKGEGGRGEGRGWWVSGWFINPSPSRCCPVFLLKYTQHGSTHQEHLVRSQIVLSFPCFVVSLCHFVASFRRFVHHFLLISPFSRLTLLLLPVVSSLRCRCRFFTRLVVSSFRFAHLTG